MIYWTDSFVLYYKCSKLNHVSMSELDEEDNNPVLDMDQMDRLIKQQWEDYRSFLNHE